MKQEETLRFVQDAITPNYSITLITTTLIQDIIKSALRFEYHDFKELAADCPYLATSEYGVEGQGLYNTKAVVCLGTGYNRYTISLARKHVLDDEISEERCKIFTEDKYITDFQVLCKGEGQATYEDDFEFTAMGWTETEINPVSTQLCDYYSSNDSDNFRTLRCGNGEWLVEKIVVEIDHKHRDAMPLISPPYERGYCELIDKITTKLPGELEPEITEKSTECRFADILGRDTVSFLLKTYDGDWILIKKGENTIVKEKNWKTTMKEDLWIEYSGCCRGSVPTAKLKLYTEDDDEYPVSLEIDDEQLGLEVLAFCKIFKMND